MSTHRNPIQALTLSSSPPVAPSRPWSDSSRSMKLLLCLAATLAPACLLTGCGVSTATAINPPSEGLTIQGRIHSGLHEVVGAHVYLLAANTTGYGSASVSLLNSSAGHSDAIGGYVLTDSSGYFSIPGGFTCSSSTQVYLYGQGGDAGTGANPSAGYLAILGDCPSANSSTPSVWMNEVTTVAAAYAFAGYATDATHVSSSGTPLALTGIQNAFAAAANLVTLGDGIALSKTPAGNGTVPQAQLNGIADILAACINAPATGSSACSTLLSTATSDGTGSGTQPTDTAGAAINMAHHPAANVAALYAIAGNGQTFSPGLVAAPSDFTLAIAFTGGGLTLASQPAVDANGNIWIADSNGPSGNGALVELNSLGAPLSPSSGFGNASLSSPDGIALDSHGNVWVANLGGNSLSEFSSNGIFATTATAPGGPLFPQNMAFDPNGSLWAASSDGVTSSLMKFSASGVYQATYTGNGLGLSDGLAIDRSGNVWVSQASNVSEFTNAGVAAANSPFFSNANSIKNLAFDDTSRLWVLNDNASVSLMGEGGPLGGYTYNTASNSSALAQALDGAGNDWIVSAPATFPVLSYNLMGITSSGNLLSSSTGYTVNTGGVTPGGMAIDGSGNVWITGGNQVFEFLGAAAPVATPVAANLTKPYAAAASRP